MPQQLALRPLGFLFRPRWIAFHVLVAAVVVLMINLGFWQLRRLDERRTDNATFVERIEQAPVALGTIIDDPAFDPVLAENRRVTVSGTYLSDQIVLFNRSQGGRAVDNVLTALAVNGPTSRVVLVNRGSIAVEQPPPAPPAVAVEVAGRLRMSEVRQRGGLSDEDLDVIDEVRRVDIDRLAPQLGAPDVEVVPMFIELIASAPEVTDGDPFPLDPPELSEGNHLSYAFQWFIFATCVAAGWVLAVRRSLATNRRKNETMNETTDRAAGESRDARVSPGGRGERTSQDSLPRVDDASPTTRS